MSDTASRDAGSVRFASTVFPTGEDMATWEKLSPAEKRAIIARDLDAGEASGLAEPEPVEQVLRRVRAVTKPSTRPMRLAEKR